MLDEQAADVTIRYMADRHHAFYALATESLATSPAPVERPRPRYWLAAAVACVAALIACHEMASAYESASLVSMGSALGTPPLMALVIYFTGTGIGRLIVPDGIDWRLASLTFLVVLPLLLTAALPSTLRAARRSDAHLIRRLVRRTKAKDGSIVIERIAPELAREAQRRIAIRAEGRTYDLADASTHSAHRRSPIDEPVTLVLALHDKPTPDEVEFEGLRGPATIYRERVALAK